MEEIKSEMQSIDQILLKDDRVYHIPEFQREFVWGRDEIEDLFNDFEEDTDDFSKDNESLQGYLLGNIVLIKEDDYYLVIDGQQRLTTITLLFKALDQRTEEIIEEFSGEERKKWIRKSGRLTSGYEVVNDDDEFEKLRINHDIGLSFGEYYRKLLRDDESINDSALLTDSDQHISDVYDAIREKLSELNPKQINKFIKYIESKVKLIETIAPSQGKAFQLFEVLNDRGRSLEPMDLVKNTFLKKLREDGFGDSETNIFNNNWSGFINNLNISKNKKIASSTFMKHFISSMYSQNIKQDRLFDYFKNEKKLSGNEILKLSEKLKIYSKTYSSLERSPLSNDFLAGDNNLFIIFKILRIKQLHPIFMQFYEADELVKKQVTDVCVKYGATIIFSSSQTNIIEKSLPEILKEINNETTYVEKLSILKSSLSLLINNYEEILFNTIMNKNYVSSTGIPLNKSLDILKFIELYVNENNLVVKSSKKITKEHILAQKTPIKNYDEYGFNDEEEFKKYLNRVGNITLLYSDENTSLGTKPVNEKKDMYRSSDFYITKTMVEPLNTEIKKGQETERIGYINSLEPQYDLSGIWKKNDIQLRGENIAKLFLNLIKI